MTEFFKNQPKLKQYSFYCSLGGLVLAILYFIVYYLYWQIPNASSNITYQRYMSYFFFASFILTGGFQIGLLIMSRKVVSRDKEEQLVKKEFLLDILSMCIFSATFVVAAIFITYYNKVVDWSNVSIQFQEFSDSLYAASIVGSILGFVISLVNIRFRLLKLERILKGQSLLAQQGQEVIKS